MVLTIILPFFTITDFCLKHVRVTFYQSTITADRDMNKTLGRGRGHAAGHRATDLAVVADPNASVGVTELIHLTAVSFHSLTLPFWQ